MNFPHIKQHLSVAQIIEQYQGGEYGAELLLQHSLKHLLEREEKMRFKAAAMAMQGLLSNPSWVRLFEYHNTTEPVGDTAAEALRQADALLSALYPSTEESTPVPDADGWIEHRPGDAMPCDPYQFVEVTFRDGGKIGSTKAISWQWGAKPDAQWAEIIAWRPAK